MKRRPRKQLRFKRRPADHHSVRVRGHAGLDVGTTLCQSRGSHQGGFRVPGFGIRRLPELYEHFNPMPFEAAAKMEVNLAEDLRRSGCTVAGGP